MRLADRPFGKVPLAPNEAEYPDLPYPGVHSFRAGRSAGLEVYSMAGITDPKKELSFVELHDAYASSEIQTYRGPALCRYGDGYSFVESGAPFLPKIDYGFPTKKAGEIPVNPSGGLIACGHPVGRHGAHAGGLRLLAVAGVDRQALPGPDAPDPEREARRDPQPRRDRFGRDGLDPRTGVLKMAKPKTFTKFKEVQAELERTGSALFRDADGVESLVIKSPYQINYIHSYAEDTPFFLGLSEGKLKGSKCSSASCGFVFATPRGHCMVCGEPTT